MSIREPTPLREPFDLGATVIDELSIKTEKRPSKILIEEDQPIQSDESEIIYDDLLEHEENIRELREQESIL